MSELTIIRAPVLLIPSVPIVAHRIFTPCVSMTAKANLQTTVNGHVYAKVKHTWNEQVTASNHLAAVQITVVSLITKRLTSNQAEVHC